MEKSESCVLVVTLIARNNKYTAKLAKVNSNSSIAIVNLLSPALQAYLPTPFLQYLMFCPKLIAIKLLLLEQATIRQFNRIDGVSHTLNVQFLSGLDIS